MLRGKRFVRQYDGVWRHRDHAMTAADWLEAARLALPADARVTGITRLQLLGLDFGPRLPLRFVVARLSDVVAAERRCVSVGSKR